MIKRRVGIILIGLLLLSPISGVAQEIDFSGHKFLEPVNSDYWKRHTSKGIGVDEDGDVNVYYPVSFFSSTFNAKADFNMATYNSTVNFATVTFNSTADFRWATFESKVDFASTSLPDNMDFRYVTNIRDEIDFTSALLPLSGKECEIALFIESMPQNLLNSTHTGGA